MSTAAVRGHAKGWITQGLDGSDQNRHIFRAAAGHYSIYSDIPGGGPQIGGRECSDSFIGGMVSKFEEFFYSFNRRRDDGHPVAPFFYREIIINFVNFARDY